MQAAVVKGGQGVAVADAHDNALGQACFDELIKRRFGGLVKRRGGFVEQHHLRLGEQNAHKGDALQFARREALLPIVVLIEFVD